MAHEIAVKAAAALRKQLSLEDYSKLLAVARAAKLIKAQNMTPAGKEERHRRHSEAMRRAYETRRRNAALKAAEADEKSEHLDSK